MSAKQNTTAYVIRMGRRKDCDDLLRLIFDLGEHEGIKNSTMTKEILLEDAFGERPFLDFFVAEFQPTKQIPSGDDGGSDGRMIPRKVVGFASVNRFNHRICFGRSAMLSGLYIDEEHRGKGLGGAIMKAVSKVCVDLGLFSIDFDVDSKNRRTREFYSSIGATDNSGVMGWEYWQFRRENMMNFLMKADSKCPSGVSIHNELL